ncbi:MAG: stage II sporulation protein M [Candidatus Woesearchaeota archaeon]
MVLESLTNPFKAERHPGKLILLGFFYVSIAIILALWVFAHQASLVFVFFAVMSAIPLMVNIIKEEEKKDVSDFHEVALLKEHSKALKAFMNLFIGMTLAVTAWYVFIPAAIFLTVVCGFFVFFDTKDLNERLQNHPSWFKRNATVTLLVIAILLGTGLGFLSIEGYAQTSHFQLFSEQIDTINKINGRVTGLASADEATSGFDQFSRIFFNNMKVLTFCIIFSFIYGAGAIFILAWNASVIGTAIGNYVRSELASLAHTIGLEKVAGYLSVVSIGLLKYVIHGIPEILAYFIAALAGGIISIGVIRHDFKGRKFEHIVLDAADLVLLSIAVLFIAAILEVWVTPMIF